MIPADYIVKKVIFAIITLVVVLVFNFFLFRVLPGDPVRLLFRNPRLTRQAQAQLRVQFGLDKPVWIDMDKLRAGDLSGALDSQFTAYVSNLLQGDLGTSFDNREDVGQLLSERVWRTVVLVFAGEALAILIGAGVGLIAAWKRGEAIDAAALIIGLLMWALPTFFLGIILLILARGVLP
ncbi:MAG TPA: ABC transporter permease, partial [Phototrophicaceae bacterium]|nr:ABC transporter permease [Phototrophicaceae bacterium]